MKKWLILLGTFGIVTTFGTTIFGCSIKMKLTEEASAENELSDDLCTLENISFEIKNYLQNNTFLNDIEIENDYLYSLVQNNEEKNIYKLDYNKKEDIFIRDSIFLRFNIFLTNINQHIKNKYSNYYINYEPINYDINELYVTIKFIDLNKINEENENNFNNSIVKVVSCEFEFNYQIKYKKQIKMANFTTNFNITNNNEGFNILKKGIINYFNQKISSFFINKQLIELAGKDFKTLYAEFKIDLKVNENNINDIFTKILQNFIKEKNIEGITYNKGKFINLESYLFNDQYDRGEYYNTRGSKLEHQLNLWIKKDEKEEDLINNFIQQYKTKIVPKLNGNIIELAKFSFNMNYINIYGLSLNGKYQYTSGKNFLSTFRLREKDINNKLSEFAKKILEFLNYFKVIEYWNNEIKQFKVSEEFWNILIENIKEKKLTTMNLPSKLWENFKNNNININEKTFKIIPERRWYSKPVFLNKEENKIFFNGGGYGTYFIFYESFIYKPFYFSSPTSMKYEIIKVV